MTLEQAREIAAQCWCDPETSHIEMDARLAEAFAHRLVAVASHPERWASAPAPVEGRPDRCACDAAGRQHDPCWIPVHTPAACWLQSGAARIGLGGEPDGKPMPAWTGAAPVESAPGACLDCGALMREHPMTTTDGDRSWVTCAGRALASPPAEPRGTFPGDLDRMPSGHTRHCEARLQWGDGECECGMPPTLIDGASPPAAEPGTCPECGGLGKKPMTLEADRCRACGGTGRRDTKGGR